MKHGEIRTLVFCFLFFGCAVGLADNCMGLFAGAIRSDMGYSTASVSMIMTVINLAVAACIPLVSALIQRTDIRKILLSGIGACSLGLIGLSLSRNLALMYMCAVLIGAGIAFFSTIPVTYLLVSWYGAKSGTATGIVMASSGIFGAVFNPVFSRCIEAWSWQNAMRFEALLVLVLTVPGACMTKPGTAIVGRGTKEKKKTRFSLSWMPFYLCAAVFPYIGAFTNHLTLLGTSLGMSLSFSASMMSLCMTANICSKAALGWLSDHTEPVKAVSVFLVLAAAGMGLLLCGEGHPALLLAGAFLSGAMSSTFTVGMAVLCRGAGEDYEHVYAFSNLLVSLVFAAYTSLVGMMKDMSGTYSPAIVLGIVSAGIGLLLCRIIGSEKKNQNA